MAETKPILIVGAGPTGLVLALWLKKMGVAFRIIDRSSAPGLTSRALAVQARTLEFYRQLGIAQDLIPLGITAKTICLRRLARLVALAEIGAAGEGMSPFPYLLFCSQDVHEGLLVRKLAELGVQVERNTELVRLQPGAGSVTATLQRAGKEEEATFSYVCGCDGAHSAVRHEMGASFPGGTYSQIFYVADVKARGEAAEAGLQISVSPKDFCIVMPIAVKGSVRLTGLVPPEAESKEKISFLDVAEPVKRHTGLNVSEVNWFSTYHVHHRVAETFRRDRIFLAGDAAHIHSPAGGQGMNTGIGDAINLAWKLAEVVQGRASPRLLESYEPERMAFAKVLVSTTDTAFKVLASRSALGSFFRTYLVPILFSTLVRFPPMRKIMFRVISQIRIRYPQSILSLGRAGQLAGGDRLPWVDYGPESADNFRPLQALAWQIHIYGEVQAPLRTTAKELGLPIHAFPWNSRVAQTGIERDVLYLVRPDGYLGLVEPKQDPAVVKRYRGMMSENSQT